MSYATAQSCTLAGINALPVTVEIHISGGLPGMSIVDLLRVTSHQLLANALALALCVPYNVSICKEQGDGGSISYQ